MAYPSTVRPLASYPTALLAALALGAGACGDPEPEPCPAMLVGGELVITEVMSDAPEGGEWIEIYNASDHEIALDGVVIAYARDRGSSGKSHVITGSGAVLPPGRYFTLGGVLDDKRPEYVNYGFSDALGSLVGGKGVLQLQCGAALVDELEYGLPDVDDPGGRAFSLSGDVTPDAAVNDSDVSWCLALEQSVYEYETDLYGTPGGPNPPCVADGPPLGMETCVVADGEAAGTLRPVVPLMPGDLVITEFMSDPGGPDVDINPADAEWFEVHVTRDVDLNGLLIGTKGDLSPGAAEGEVLLTLKDVDMRFDDAECVPVAAGEYLLFARDAEPTLNGELPAPDFTFSFDIRNTGDSGLFLGLINNKGGADALDLVTYEGVSEGAAWALSPAALDPAANNDLTSWCLASEPYGAGGTGSPGAANPACVGGPAGDTCLDGDQPREPVRPGPGDLVITELMANPAAVGDGEGEWLELTATADVDLTGVELGRGADVELTLGEGDPRCFPLAAGERALLAKPGDAATNGGLPEPDFVFDFSLVNTSGDVFVGYRGELVDRVTYTSAPDGAALQLSADAIDAALNDDEASWCPAITPYGDGDLGTPRAENAVCGQEPPPGQCDDNGQPRDPVAPTPGDLVISEFMANPDAVTDADGEWLELRATADFDLNGLRLAKTEADLASASELDDPACLRVTAGQHLLLAKKSDAAVNGGLPPVDLPLPFSLTNSADGIFVGHGETLIDGVTYASSQGAGVAVSLDPGASAADNDDADVPPWCDAVAAYGDGDLGTPGEENPACG
ncbi:MAG: lamin tail domain-containing protein [Myxococcales bacterium]|nr:lamin tail domain-containing protein [Myxococcales bacterium]